MTDKTHFSDDETLAYIAQLESKLAAANARLAVAEKVNSESPIGGTWRHSNAELRGRSDSDGPA